MNINEMKLGDLMALVGALQGTKSEPHPFVGQYVICRCTGAGVHAGELVSQTGDQAVLKNSRRLWYWKTKGGIALSGLAKYGAHADSTFDALVDSVALTGVCETIPCADVAKESINAAAKR